MSDNDRWEDFARRDAEFYIAGGAFDARDAASRERFFKSGRDIADRLFEQVADDLPGNGLAIEIGCGVGRLLMPMAERFDRAIGVDVSTTMLTRLADNSRRLGVENVEPMTADDTWDNRDSADFIYSWIVFQHVEDAATIKTTIRRAATALKPGGVALFQFDTRRRTAAYLVRNTLPDIVLPRLWRRGIRRIRRRPDRIAAILDAAGLRTLREHGAGTDVHVLTLQCV
jgi:2-polyprenyl-3-methyl-5-hydroxy-6-metoxy-1,4-benzoquinol methylase